MRPKRTVCKRCNTASDQLSTRGICPECADKKALEAADQLHRKEGPIYEKWKAAMEKVKPPTKIEQKVWANNYIVGMRYPRSRNL